MNPHHELELLHTYRKVIREVKPDAGAYLYHQTNVCRHDLFREEDSLYHQHYGIGNRSGGRRASSEDYDRNVPLRHAWCDEAVFSESDQRAVFYREKDWNGKHDMLPGSGVNLERFPYLEYPPEDEKIEFLFISRVLKEKGIDQYLGMAEVIKRKYPNTVFRILGFCEDDDSKPDSYRNKIRALEEKGIVSFEGMQEDVHPFLRHSQCTVHLPFTRRECPMSVWKVQPVADRSLPRNDRVPGHGGGWCHRTTGRRAKHGRFDPGSRAVSADAL